MKQITFNKLSIMYALCGVSGVSGLISSNALAQGVATEQMQSVTIGAVRAPLAAHLPNTMATLSDEELRAQQNIFNPEDALRTMPNTGIRKRYSGDRNALISGRSFGSTQAARALVLMDGYLLSNFLGRFDAPRWNMLAPEDLERVDMLYGPYSAIFPGNAIGSTVIMTTRKPGKLEASARIAVQSEDYRDYGHSETFTNTQTTFRLGDKLASGLWYRLLVNRQDSTGHPMQYYALNAAADGSFSKPAGIKPVTAVSGIQYDLAPTGQRRAVFGANSGAIDHTVQTTAKLSWGADLSPALTLDGMLAWWYNDSASRNRSFLKDAQGNSVWSGRVSQNGNVFDVPANAFAPFNRQENNLQAGLTLKTRYREGWNQSLVASQYQLLKDVQRTAAQADPLAANGGSGSATVRDGTRFRTMEYQATYTPVANDWGRGQHALSLGLHANDYHLQQNTQNLSDWRIGQSQPVQSVAGDTRLLALYLQDAWRFAPDWKATAGLRYEDWQASHGRQEIKPLPAVSYADRHLQAWSPKFSLSWEATDDLSLRASLGRGTRFATVAELFQGSQSGNTLVVNDPYLRPERSDAAELVLEKRLHQANLRLSLYQDKVRDSIWSQTNVLVFPNITNVQNVGLVRTRGIELAGDVRDWLIPRLDLNANLAWNQSRILENERFPASVGKNWVRIPDWRANITLAYQWNAQWNLAGSYRYSGRQYNELSNSDIIPDTYGGSSRIRQLDLRLRFRPAKGVELAAGIDNVGNQLAYQYHPLPGRSLFAEMRYNY